MHTGIIVFIKNLAPLFLYAVWVILCFVALSGKVTSFLGPLLVGTVTALTGNARLGMSVIVVLMLAGLVVLLTVKAPQARKAPSA